MEERFSAGPEELERACLRENYCGISYAENENLGATYQLILEAYKDNHATMEEYDSILSFRPMSGKRSERDIPEDYLHTPFAADRLADTEPEFAMPVIAKRDLIQKKKKTKKIKKNYKKKKEPKKLNKILSTEPLQEKSGG